MTAFADFLDLQTAVIEQVGTADIADVMPRLVRLAEVKFNNRLRCREQVSSTTLTISSGSASLPSDFVEAIGLYDDNGFEYVQQPLQSNRIQAKHRHFYAIEGTTLTTSGPDGDKTLQYYAALPSITDSVTDSNWLLQKHPAAYLYTVSAEAAKQMRDPETAQQMMALADMEMAAIEAQDARERYSRARVRVTGVTP